jgi:hypothetical protein
LLALAWATVEASTAAAENTIIPLSQVRRDIFRRDIFSCVAIKGIRLSDASASGRE